MRNIKRHSDFGHFASAYLIASGYVHPLIITVCVRGMALKPNKPNVEGLLPNYSNRLEVVLLGYKLALWTKDDFKQD